MELHTLDVNGGYGRRDVQELAPTLTGLGVSLPGRGAGSADQPPGKWAKHGATSGWSSAPDPACRHASRSAACGYCTGAMPCTLLR